MLAYRKIEIIAFWFSDKEFPNNFITVFSANRNVVDKIISEESLY